MKIAVIDTSVFLALFLKEPVREETRSIFASGRMSVVNIAEVFTKLAEWKLPITPDVEHLLGLLESIEPLSLEQARLTGELRSRTSHKGIGLGDRCCMALALSLDADLYTMEKSWTEVESGCRVRLLRPHIV